MRSDEPSTRLASVAIVSPGVEKQATLLFDRLYVPTPPYDCFALDSAQAASFSSIPNYIAFRQRELDVLVLQAGFAYINALYKITKSPPVRKLGRVIARTSLSLHPSQFEFGGRFVAKRCCGRLPP